MRVSPSALTHKDTRGDQEFYLTDKQKIYEAADRLKVNKSNCMNDFSKQMDRKGMQVNFQDMQESQYPTTRDRINKFMSLLPQNNIKMSKLLEMKRIKELEKDMTTI